VAGHGVVRRDTAGLQAIAWFGPAQAEDVKSLARWRASVGPPVVRQLAASSLPTVADEITVVSWNTAVGDADVLAFARSLPPGKPIVMMLQEVYRDGPEVPRELVRDALYAGFLGGAGSRSHDIEAIAETLGMNAYYVPSMRNGPPLISKEDRGNAILSNLPLSDLAAIELPFERQRRVAVAATIRGKTSTGADWQLRLVSTHLDNMVGPKYGWLGGEYGRARQARGLRDAVASEMPTILAGDFNTWFGYSEQTYIETARAYPETRVTDRRATFRGLLRLDHVFYRLAPGWRAEFHRGDDRFGSDHSPLVGAVRFH
jgi:endonuclease/exonuclease/phosphatase family metal-dependent hydrolase